MRTIALILAIVAVLSLTDAFQASKPKNTRKFKGGPLEMTVLAYGGKKKNFKAGSSLKSAVSALGVKPKYSCKK